MLEPDQPGVFLLAANQDAVEVMEVEADAVLVEEDDTPYGPWGSLSDSSSILRMCMQDDYPDGISVSSNTTYPFDRVCLPRGGMSPDYFTSGDSTPGDFFTRVTVAPPPTLEVDDDYPGGARQHEEYAVEAASLQPFECLTCRRVYVSEKGLVRHQRVMHGPRVWHVCDVCGKPLASPGSLRSHKWLHSNRRPFECPLCSAGFIRRPLLRAHMRSRHAAVANLTVKLEELDVNERAPSLLHEELHVEDHDGQLQHGAAAAIQDHAHHEDGGGHPRGALPRGAHPRDVTRPQGARHPVGVDSGGLVYVMKNADSDEASDDSGLSSSSSSRSSSQEPFSEGTPSPASSADSEHSVGPVDGHIVVRLVRDSATGSWKIDLDR